MICYKYGGYLGIQDHHNPKFAWFPGTQMRLPIRILEPLGPSNLSLDEIISNNQKILGIVDDLCSAAIGRHAPITGVIKQIADPPDGGSFSGDSFGPFRGGIFSDD